MKVKKDRPCQSELKSHFQSLKELSEVKEEIIKMEQEGKSQTEIQVAQDRQNSLILKKAEMMKRLSHLETDINAKRKDLSKAK